MQTKDYTNRITSEYATSPKFNATVAMLVDALVDLQNLVLSFPSKYDIDFAVGNQLDRVGLWIGLPRQLSTVFSGKFFTWNDTVDDGWKAPKAPWSGQFGDPNGIIVMSDVQYRIALYMKIMNNNWNGSIGNAYELWNSRFADAPIHIKDNFDMTAEISVTGTHVIDQDFFVFLMNQIQLFKPAGVSATYLGV